MQIKRDIYNLGKSKNIEISSIGIDIKADIILSSNEKVLNINSTVSGMVVDTLNNPIKNAIVKLIDGNLDSLSSIRTDENGKYVINTVPSSARYTVITTAIEKIVNQSPSFTLKTGENKVVNFTLSNDPNAIFTAISGTLTDSNNSFIKGAVISLYTVNENTTNLFAITYSDIQGTFLFSELLPGKYKVSIESITNMAYEEIIIVESRKIYNFNKVLTLNSNLSEGSITGSIRDNLGNTISKADVILYKVENDIKTPIAFTQTNTFGLYSFANVPFGFYLVKSNSTQSLDINNLISPSVKITSTSELGTYNLSEGILENDAMVEYSTGVVVALGGKTDGSVTLSVNIDKYGLYTLAVYYLSADFNRPLKVNINGNELDEIYKVPVTPGWELTDSKILYIQTALNEGINTIKFHGDGTNLAPSLSMVTLIFNETSNELMSTTTFTLSSKKKYINIGSEGNYSNEAKYNEKTFLATGIGGVKNGSVTVNFALSDTTVYYMQLVYVASVSNLILKMDVTNNSVTTYTLTLPATIKTADPLSLSSFTLPIDLALGKNEIKFYGDSKTVAPDLSGFYLVVPPVTQNLTEGFLENGAKVDSSRKFVQGIGGVNNGSSIVTIDIATPAYYKLYVEYVSPTTVPLKVDVNSTKPSTIVYMLPGTKGLTANDTKIFTILIYLNAGYNTLKFYGNGKDVGPNISSFGVTKTDTIGGDISNINLIKDIYEPNFAKLEGSAILDKGKLKIVSLGGKNNGTALFNVMVKETGEYLLGISYENNKNFKMDINQINTNKIYTTFGEIKGIFKTTINLKSGNNTIKIYGNSSELAPDIGQITLSFNAPLSLKKDDFLFYEGAKLLPSGVITSIGGANKGIISIGYFSSEYAEYTLNFILSNTAGEFFVRINNENFHIKNIPTTKAVTIPYSINVILESGFNFIDILGNGNTVALDIYNVDIKPAFADISKYTFNLAAATLKNNANVNLNNGFVEKLGGKDNGLAILNFKLDKADSYNLNIQYINEYDGDTPLRLKVNGKTIEKTYYLPKDISKYFTKNIFIIENISLNQGNNTIEFSGMNTQYVAKLGKVRLSKFLNTNTLPSNLYYAINGTFENGAKQASFSKNFIDNLGGKQDGSLTIKIEIEDNDFYNLTIVYLSTDNRILLIEVNGEDTGTVYNLPKTDDLKEENSKMFQIPIRLKLGTNVIKFHGDKTNLAPSIGKIYINKSPEMNTYSFLDAILVKAEIVDSPNGFIALSGDASISSATIKINVEKTASYYLTFSYLSPYESLIIIETNYDFSNNKQYTLPLTKSKNVIDSKTFTIKVNLISGENTISFLKADKSNNIIPLFESLTISENLLTQTFPLKKAALFNGAYFNEKIAYVQGIGGLKNGYAVLDVLVEQTGQYNLVINYLSLNVDRKLKLTVNKIPMEKSYYLPTTSQYSHKKISKTFTIPIDLKSGMNSIKIHGDRNTKEGPMINEITVSLNTNDLTKIYYISDGNIKGATVDKENKIVSNIGGKFKGESTVKLNILSSNIYNLNLQYKSPNKQSVLILDINNIGNITTYTLPMTFDNNFNSIDINIYLNTGDNSLRFYGDENNNNLILGSFTLTPNISSSISEKNVIYFDIALGDHTNGAKGVLKKNNMTWVTNLGGEKNGTSTTTINVDTEGEYSLIIAYSTNSKKINTPLSLTLAVNSNSTGKVYQLIGKNQYDMSIKKYEFIVNLKKGKNTITFSGDGKNESPDLGPGILTFRSKKN